MVTGLDESSAFPKRQFPPRVYPLGIAAVLARHLGGLEVSKKVRRGLPGPKGDGLIASVERSATLLLADHELADHVSKKFLASIQRGC